MFSDYENKVMKSQTVTLKNNTDVTLNGVKPGATIMVEVDKDGIPLNQYWRRRMKDSAVDNCVSVVSQKKKEIK